MNQFFNNFVPEAARDVSHSANDFAGEKIKAFGLRHSVQRTPINSGISHRVALSDNMSRMISTNHLAMNPGLPLCSIGGEVAHCRSSIFKKRGGAFRRRIGEAGGSFLPSG